MGAKEEIDQFLETWTDDAIGAKQAFVEYEKFLSGLADARLEFKARPKISYSMRAARKNQKSRNVFALVDVVDDDPANRWLSVCFFADMVTDPEERGDTVPDGLDGEDAICFNLDEDDPQMRAYIGKRLEEAAARAEK